MMVSYGGSSAVRLGGILSAGMPPVEGPVEGLADVVQMLSLLVPMRGVWVK